MIEWIIILSLIVGMYIIIYKYEKKMDSLQKSIDENKDRLDEHQKRIKMNQSKLKEHNNHIEQMWVTLPKSKDED